MKWHKRNNDDLDEDLDVKKQRKNDRKREKKKSLRQRKKMVGKWTENDNKIKVCIENELLT